MKSTYAILAGFAILLNLTQFTLAHGYVKVLTIDGEEHKGPLPKEDSGNSIIRGISTSFPVKGVDGNDIICGPNAQNAGLMGAAKPGSKLTFDWAGGDNGKWPHDTGPMITYITSCNGDCTKFDPANAPWTKIEEVSRKSDSNKWVQSDLFEGGTYSFNLPQELPNGNYLIRHEIIGLHIASNKGGAEFYPSCAQLTISGGQDGSLPSDQTVKFPGAYSETDPGILVNAFDGKPYNFPGGNVARLGNKGGDSNNGNTGDNNNENNNGGDNNNGGNDDGYNDGNDDNSNQDGNDECEDDDDSQNDENEDDGNTDASSSVSASATRSVSETASVNDPALTTVVATVTRTRAPSTVNVVSTVTVVSTVFVDARSLPSVTPLYVLPKETPASAQKADDSFRLRLRRSRIVGRSHI